MLEEKPNLVSCYDSVKIKKSPKQLGYRHIADRIEEIIDTINVVLEIKKQKLEEKHKIEKHLEGFEGLEHRVVYLKEVENKPLYQVADDLGYSYDWIRKIHAKVNKEGTKKAHIEEKSVI